MRATIFEPDPAGHRLHFVRLIAQGLVDRGVHVTWVTSKEAARSLQAAIHLADLEDVMDVRASVSAVPPGSTGVVSRFRDLRHLVTEVSHRVYVPYADHIAQLAALPVAWPRRGAPVEGLMFRARFAYPRESAKDSVLRVASRRAVVHTPWSRLFVLDPLAAETFAGRRTLALMPEPVEQREVIAPAEARRRLGLREVDHLISLVGTIDARKGAIELAKGFAAAHLEPGVQLAFIGPIGEDVGPTLRALADRHPGIQIVDRHLDAEDFWLAMCAGDLVAAPYLRHVGSSGIVARAAYLGRPLITSNYGWVGEATRRFGLGAATDTTNPALISTALEDLVASGPRSTRSPRSSAYVEFNTPQRFTDLWLQSLDEDR